MAEGGANYRAPAPAEHRTLLVQGLPPGTSSELLELYFENPKSGGGDVESVKLEDQGRARVVFQQLGVVENILEYGNHKFRGMDLFVQRAPVEERVNEEEQKEEERIANNDEVETNAILVQGFKPNTDREVLELFFENTKRSGGGEIADVKMYQKSGRAIIWFTEAATVQTVLRKGPMILFGSELTITPYVEEAMVKISGINQEIPEETLELFFENTKRSGGGEIKNIDMLLPMQAAIITFEDETVANRVVDKHTFTLSKCQLIAERFNGLKPDSTSEINNKGPKPEEEAVKAKVDEVSPNKPKKKKVPTATLR